MNETEMWVDVPGTDGRFAVSNLGVLRCVAKKELRFGKMSLVFVNERRTLVSDYKTGALGWWVYFDGKKCFLPRDELMTLFPECVRHPDLSHDDEARDKREETYKPIDDLKADARQKKNV